MSERFNQGPQRRITEQLDEARRFFYPSKTRNFDILIGFAPENLNARESNATVKDVL